MSYTVEERGGRYTADYSVYFKDAQGNYVSPFHDIPTWADKEKGIVNMVCEVPRWSNAKMEVVKDFDLNPIRQDTKKGKLRFVHNCFPHHGYIWNYGCVPQTWENPNEVDTHTGEKGDNDPLDICDISASVATIGEVRQVKVLGILAMIDEGETDWKVIGIDVRDPRAESLNSVEDLEKVMRGYLAATVEWFRIYKIPAGKPENKFAFDGEAKDKAFAIQVIEETRQQWQNLVDGKADSKITLKATTTGSQKIAPSDAAAIVSAAPAPAPPAEVASEVHDWHFITIP